jgi:hypothetical protein
MAEKRFDDEQVSLILRRAMENDAGRPDAGLTLRQLKEIAAEVGIDPAQVEAAALAVQAERAVGERRGLRVSTRYDVQVDGELPPERRAEAIRLIRSATRRQGIVTEEVGGGIGWRARDAFGGRYVTIHTEDGKTRIEALGNFRDGAMTVSAGGGVLGMATTAIVLKAFFGGVAALGLVGPVAVVAGAAIPTWALYRRWFAREDAALRRAVADIAARIDAERTIAAEPDPAPGLPPGAASPADDGPPRR